jgi:predicted RNA-binding Zn-ribbon protein involved in translation (DUF1610 family)
METIYRTHADTEVMQTATEVECPYCGESWLERDTDDCGRTYVLDCEGCEKQFKMHFDAS